jgi:protease IV
MSQPSNTPSTVVVVPSQPSWFSRFFSWLGWFLFGMTFISIMGLVSSRYDYFDKSGGIQEKFVSGSQFGTKKIAVISIEGVIMEGDGFVKRQIERIRDDKNVHAIVVRVDSPGGTITGSDYILHHLKKLKEEKGIPLVVSMGSIAASGGYYVSMAVGDAEKTIYAEPTTTTGSIGVIIPHYDISGLMEQYNVKDDSIASHPRKQMLSMTKQLNEENRALVQGYVNEAFVRFKDIIKQGRPAFEKAPEKLDTLATGEIFSAVKAHEEGLVDELGFLEDAVARAAELASLDLEQTRVVRFEREVSLFDLGASANARANYSNNNLNMLFELSSPRAYYLSSTLPAFFSTKRAD